MNRRGNYSYDTLPREEDGEDTRRPVPARRRLKKATAFAVMFAFAVFFSLLAISRYSTMTIPTHKLQRLTLAQSECLHQLVGMRWPRWLLLHTCYLPLDGPVFALFQCAF